MAELACVAQSDSSWEVQCGQRFALVGLGIIDIYIRLAIWRGWNLPRGDVSGFSPLTVEGLFDVPGAHGALELVGRLLKPEVIVFILGVVAIVAGFVLYYS